MKKGEERAHTWPVGEPLEELLERATAAARERRMQEADLLLNEILSQDPDNRRGLDLLGFIRYFQGRPSEGEEACRRVLAREPAHAYAFKGLGLNLAAQGRIEEGVTALEEAIRLEPGWFDPYWDLACVLIQAQRPDDARQLITRAQAAVPTRRADFARLAVKLKG